MRVKCLVQEVKHYLTCKTNMISLGLRWNAEYTWCDCGLCKGRLCWVSWFMLDILNAKSISTESLKVILHIHIKFAFEDTLNKKAL